MKSIAHKITSVFMTFVVLFSTMSFTINMHYCGDTLVDLGVFKQAKTCGMEMNESIPTSDNTFSKKGCCTDKHITVEGQDELNLTFDNLSLNQQIFITSFVYSYLNLFNDLKEKEKIFNEYPPPLIVKKIYKFDEVYLI